jgi:hypothetical protein
LLGHGRRKGLEQGTGRLEVGIRALVWGCPAEAINCSCIQTVLQRKTLAFIKYWPILSGGRVTGYPEVAGQGVLVCGSRWVDGRYAAGTYSAGVQERVRSPKIRLYQIAPDLSLTESRAKEWIFDEDVVI